MSNCIVHPYSVYVEVGWLWFSQLPGHITKLEVAWSVVPPIKCLCTCTKEICDAASPQGTFVQAFIALCI
jgi:hypothetical protein